MNALDHQFGECKPADLRGECQACGEKVCRLHAPRLSTAMFCGDCFSSLREWMAGRAKARADKQPSPPGEVPKQGVAK